MLVLNTTWPIHAELLLFPPPSSPWEVSRNGSFITPPPKRFESVNKSFPVSSCMQEEYMT